MKVSCLVFFMITLTTHFAMGQGPSRLRMVRAYQGMVSEQMAWVNGILNSGREDEQLDSIINEFDYTPLAIAVHFAVNDVHIIYDRDAWEELVIRLLQAGANPIYPILVETENEINPLGIAMEKLTGGIVSILWDVLPFTNTNVHNRYDHRVRRVVVALLRARDGLGVF